MTRTASNTVTFATTRNHTRNHTRINSSSPCHLHAALLLILDKWLHFINTSTLSLKLPRGTRSLTFSCGTAGSNEALLCYVCAGSVDKLVSASLAAAGTMTSRTTQQLIAKATVLRKALTSRRKVRTSILFRSGLVVPSGRGGYACVVISLTRLPTQSPRNPGSSATAQLKPVWRLQVAARFFGGQFRHSLDHYSHRTTLTYYLLAPGCAGSQCSLRRLHVPLR